MTEQTKTQKEEGRGKDARTPKRDNEGKEASEDNQKGRYENAQREEDVGEKTLDKETERRRNQDDGLFALLQRVEITSQILSDLVKQRDSFGLAWLLLLLIKKHKAEGKTSLVLPDCVDLSGSSGVSPDKMFLLMELLPSSIEQMKADAVVVKRRALPLFVRFLERVKAAREGREEAPPLKRFVFAENSIGPEEAPEVFRLLVPLLQHLCLNGNPLGAEGFRALAEVVASGGASPLRVLDLENTMTKTRDDLEALELLCDAIKQQNLRVETLNLSGNRFSEQRMGVLGQILCAACLPCVRQLRLANCEMDAWVLERLADSLGGSSIPTLETLDLEENDGLFDSLDEISGMIRAECLPSLKNLRLQTSSTISVMAVKEFLKALESAERPCGLQNVPLNLAGYDLEDDHTETFQGLGAGRYAPVRPLSLSLIPLYLGAFLRGVVENEKGPWVEVHDLTVDLWEGGGPDVIGDPLQLLGDLIGMGRLSSLRQVKMTMFDWTESNFLEGRRTFLASLSHVKFNFLSEFCAKLNDEHAVLLAEAVRVGSVSQLRVLDLTYNREGLWTEERGRLGRVGMEALMGAVTESQEGLASLDVLNVSFSRAGEGAGYLGMTLMSGKLPRLSKIDLSNSNLTDEGVRGLAEAVRGGGFAGVVSLDLRAHGVRGWEDGIEAEVEPQSWEVFARSIAESQGGLPKMKQLLIGQTREDHFCVWLGIAMATGKLPCVEKLEPARISLDTQSVPIISDAVRENQFPPAAFPLTLCVREGSRDVNLDNLIRAIAESRERVRVGELELRGGQVGEEALIALASSERGNLSYLKYLDLSDCEIDDSKLKRWGEVFRAHECPKLGSIKLSKNRITLEGISGFFKTLEPESLPELCWVDWKDQEGQEEVGDGGVTQKEFLFSIKALRQAAQSEGKVPSLNRIF
uniref:Uncharacterized protein n=1 Tax=Chromera velia CCMP2878 TaxID=1169474 RepID=A0A0G4FAL6_9ALVE|eukprot:Cvel_3032.t1-p1 / transcript=Cvel_3032.t1 / gene=Cvel_3032 / organism=Chromera_velia_CCMP2878 / gene_product=hypothetical protein / transcript_product=hypothetical protein / location=Cvel_scaffold121:41478-46936(-) / protein_length=920 / sequence_SO=supercontig / SO=protein_coding / is_pseudo=false